MKESARHTVSLITFVILMSFATCKTLFLHHIKQQQQFRERAKRKNTKNLHKSLEIKIKYMYCEQL